MNVLSAEQLLALWERGARRHALDRGLVLLSCARPGIALDALADVPVGARDQALLELRRALFGAALPSFTDCPACGLPLEFSVDSADLRAESAPDSFEVDGWRLRPPTSRDLAIALREPDAASAERCLAIRCVLDPPDGGTLALSESDMAAVQLALATADVAADIELEFDCVSCGHRWRSAFDIASYLWQEIDVSARRLLHDVDALARAYGWTERDVLALSDARRRTYVEMVAP